MAYHQRNIKINLGATLLLAAIMTSGSDNGSKAEHYSQMAEALQISSAPESSVGDFSHWSRQQELLPIYDALRGEGPDDFVMGPVESSCWCYPQQPCLWFAALNYIYPISGTDEPAILQVWRPATDEKPLDKIQEYRLPQAMVEEMAWVDVGDKWLLYVITRETTNQSTGTLACLQLKEDGSGLDLVSEEEYGHLIWLMPDLSPWGPVFVAIQFLPLGAHPTPDWVPDYEQVALITYNDMGFFQTDYVPLGSFVSLQEWDKLSEGVELSGDELRDLISSRMMVSDEWRDRLIEGSVYFRTDNPELRINSDGSTYYSRALSGWSELSVNNETDSCTDNQ